MTRVFLLAIALLAHASAFVVRSPSAKLRAPLLFMSEQPPSADDQPTPEETPEAAAAAEQQPEEIPEDPEITALKEDIKRLESELQQKRRDLAYTSDRADEYSQSGYARKVAEMENMRRARTVRVKKDWL